jgi:hypothetical protein
MISCKFMDNLLKEEKLRKNHSRVILQYSLAANGQAGILRFLTNGSFEINFEMSVSLPSRSNKKGMLRKRFP